MPQNHFSKIKLPKIVSLLLVALVILTPVSHTFAQATSIDLDAAEVLLGSINDAAANAWLDVKEEYDQSFGSNGCYARQWYMEGYTVGVLAETAIPLAKAGKLGNTSKLADLNKAASGDVGDKLDAAKKILSGVRTANTVTMANIGGTINRLKSGATYIDEGTGIYSQVAGHHPLAKVAFQGDPSYKQNQAFSVSDDTISDAWHANNSSQNYPLPQVVHAQITGRQNSLYRGWVNSNQNKILTIDDMADIEVQAMVEAGISESIAKGWVVRGLEDLQARGVQEITNIPWGPVNLE